MGIQPQNAMSAQGYLEHLQSLGGRLPDRGLPAKAPGTAFDGSWDPGYERRKRYAEIWGSGQKGAPNYNLYEDKDNPMNRTSGAGVMGQWRGHTQGVDNLQERAMYGLGGTGPTAAMKKDDQNRVNVAQQSQDHMSDFYKKHKYSMMKQPRGIGDPLYALRQKWDEYRQKQQTKIEPITPSNPTPGIFVPGQNPAPSSDETPSDNSIPTPPTTKPTQPGGLGGMPPSTPIGSPYYKMNTSENPLMNTMKPRQKPQFGTLGANRGMNGMGLGPNSVAKPGVYGTY